MQAMDVVRLRPKFSPLLESSMARILPVDNGLALQLCVVSMMTDFAEREFEHAYQLYKSGAAPETVRESLETALEFSEEAHEAITRSVTRIDVITQSLAPGVRLAWYRMLRVVRKDELKEDKVLKAQWDRSVSDTSTNGE